MYAEESSLGFEESNYIWPAEGATEDGIMIPSDAFDL